MDRDGDNVFADIGGVVVSFVGVTAVAVVFGAVSDSSVVAVSDSIAGVLVVPVSVGAKVSG